MRTLLLLRHAHADGAPRDLDRPLTKRGRSQAEGVGRYLRGEDLLPDTAVVSNALRARQTLESLTLDPATRTVEAPGLYAGGVAELLDILRPLSGDRLLVVGHNPTVSGAARALSGDGDTAALSRLDAGLPPAGLAVIRLPPGDWGALGSAAGTLVRMVAPAS